MRSQLLTTSGLLALASQVSAQVASVCPSTNVCFGLNIPANTASSGSGDIFFQISAPSSYEWVALGQGRGMAGSNIFVVYTSASGTNVTLSPRTASSYSAPSTNANAQVTLLEGSGVSNGIMTANVRCSNCNSWSGGTMDFTSSSGNWIYGYQSSGGPKNTDSTSASIRQHSGEAVFSWDFASAKGGSSVNPLISTASSSGTGTGTGTTASSCRARPASATSSGSNASAATAASPTQTSDDSDDDDSNDDYTRWNGKPTARPTARSQDKRADLPYCDEVSSGNGNSNSNTGFTPITSFAVPAERMKMLIAHGVLASLAFVIFFPAGSIAIRLASFPGVIWLHAAFQIFAYLVYIAGFGLGVFLASEMNLLNHHHAIIGIVVLVLVFVQPITGWLHHSLFTKYNHRTLWSYAHIWLGRIAVTLGIINGGLGLRLADSMNMSSQGGIIAYGVIAGLVWLVWVAAMVIGERRRKRALANTPPKYTESPLSTSAGDVRGTRADITPPNGHYAPKGQ